MTLTIIVVAGAAFLQHAAGRVGRAAVAGVRGLRRCAAAYHLQVPAQVGKVSVGIRGKLPWSRFSKLGILTVAWRPQNSHKEENE